MAKIETHFIKQNKGPNDYIGVYNGTELVGKVKANALKMPDLGEKLYSFGALSDVHVSSSDASKLQKALAYFNSTEKVAFTCIAGDLTGTGTEAQFQYYRQAVGDYSVYACTGNHDCQDPTVAPFESKDSTQPYIGQDLYYSFTHGDDVFIMFGMRGWSSYTGVIFTDDSLRWLSDELEKYRNKRCFVFEHCPSMVYSTTEGVVVANDGSGKPYNSTTSGAVLWWRLPTGNLLNQSNAGQSFRELMAHYKNIVWFHGHSHMDFYYQAECSQVIYDKNFGCHSIHVPALASGRKLKEDGSGWENPVGGYGYVVDVYRNHIVLRGRDFVADKFLPTATYCLETIPGIIK